MIKSVQCNEVIFFILQQAGKKSLSRTLGWMDQYLEDTINKVLFKRQRITLRKIASLQSKRYDIVYMNNPPL